MKIPYTVPTQVVHSYVGTQIATNRIKKMIVYAQPGTTG